MQKKKNRKNISRRGMAWALLFVMTVNSFGGYVQSGMAKVSATDYTVDYEKASEEAEAEIRAAEEAAGIRVKETLGSNETEELVYESLTISNGTTLTKDMEVGDLSIKGDLHLNGYRLTVHGSMIVNDDLYMEEGFIAIEGNLYENSNAKIWMESHNDYIQIDGNYIYANSYLNNQNKGKGTWEIKGNIMGASGSNCESNNVFEADCKVIISGNEKQTIDINTDSNMVIKHLIIENTSEEGVHSKHMLMSDQLEDTQEKLHYMCEGNVGNVLTQDLVIEGDYCLTGGVLDLAGHSMVVQGDFLHAGGVLQVNGGSLTIEGSYKQQLFYEEEGNIVTDYSSGRLVMNQEADYVCIKGDFVDCGRRETKDDLTSGTLELQGSFLAENGLRHTLFQTGSNHTVKLTGSGTQVIQTGDSYIGDYIRFGNLVIEQADSGSVQWSQAVAVTGGIAHKSSNVSGITRIEGAIINSTDIYGDVEIPNDCIFQSDVVFHGNLTAGYGYNYTRTMTIDSCHVIVKGNYNNNNATINGATGTPIFTVEKDFVLGFGNNSTVSNIILEICGNVVKNDDAYLSCGADSEVHFIGNTEQNVGISHEETLLTNVVVDNPAGVVVEDNVTILNVSCRQGILSYTSGGVHGFTLEEDGEYDGDLVIGGGTLDLNGHKYHVKGNLTIVGGTLNMTHAEDYLLVDGDFKTTSVIAHEGKLTNGVLEIKGNFDQQGNKSSFAATQDHTTIFSGEEQQKVTFSNVRYSYFSNLELQNEKGVVAKDTLPVAGNVIQNGPLEGFLGIKKTTILKNGRFQGDVLILESVTMSEDWVIDGDFKTNDSLFFNMNGKMLTVTKECIICGSSYLNMKKGSLQCGKLSIIDFGGIIMKNAEERITVTGDFLVSSRYSNYLKGQITVGGDVEFVESYINEFDEAVSLELNGTSLQTVTMNGAFSRKACS